jgi:radical SAM protein with 4Fe4S-binding SPASM domain
MYNLPPADSRYMTEKVMERACKEVADRSCNLEISAYGETFQHPTADDFLFLARKLCPNAEIVVATNGSLLNRERCEKIVDSGIDHISFSLDAGSPESYEWLCQSKDYEKVCHNLETLVEVRNARAAKHLRITTHILGIKELSHEFDDFMKRWSDIVDAASVRNYGNWAGLVNKNGITPAEEQKVPDERYPCVWLWYATKIEPNGDVSKCFIHVTGDKNPLGNIMEQSFDSIWQGEKLQRLRDLHCSNKYAEVEFCENCNVWSLFPKFWRKKKKFGLFDKGVWI